MSKTDLKKENILKAATECFARFGYDKTTLDDIGSAVKLNKASLYYYYKNKEEIFNEVILRESSAFMESLQAKVLEIENPDDKVVTYLIERLRYYRKVVNLHHLSIENLRTLEPMFHKLYTETMDLEISFLGSILKDKTQESSPEKIAETLLIVADSLKHRAVQESGKIFASEVDYTQTEQETEFVTHLILRGLTKQP